MHEMFTGNCSASNQLKEITVRFGEFENGKWRYSEEPNSEKFTDRFEKFQNENFFEIFEK